MEKHALHPYLTTIMGLASPPAEGTDPQVEPEPELAPASGASPMGQEGAGPPPAPGQASAEGPPGESPPPAGPNGPPPDVGGDLPPAAALAGAMPGASTDPAAPPDPGMAPNAPPDGEGLPTPGMPDPNDPLRNTKDEGLYAVNELQIIEALQKILAGKYAIMVMYLHYGATMMTLERDGLYKHFLEHAKEERESAYLVATKIVAMGGQAAPKVGTVRPAALLPEMLMELLKAEQKVQHLWCELALAAGQNVGLQSFAQSQGELDMHHADDIRRWLRSAP